jgi:hypothetical protein
MQMWRSYPREWLLLSLVAIATLGVINPPNVQDITRISLSRSLAERGSVDIDPYHRLTTDRAFFDGHWYSDKAPGLSLLALPTVEALRGIDALRGDDNPLPIWKRVGHIWLIRVLTSGVGLLAAAWLVGRAAEALRPGYAAPVVITFALGTIAGPLGVSAFEHVDAAALGFAAFVVASRRSPLLPIAGALAGAAVLFEYQAALIVLVVAVYVAYRHGPRRLLAFCAGGVPAAIGLGAYDWAAFGSPLHLSYKYVANSYTARQQQGFFGIGSPTLHGAHLVFLDGKGLLVVSPVLVAAAAGLVLLWRRRVRAEAAACAAVTLLFLFANMAYFEPYGGVSPGPRFFAPALPFLALGLVEAYHRWPIPTGVLALWSMSVTTLDGITWAILNKLYYRYTPNTIWARAPLVKTEGGFYLLFVAAGVAVAYGVFELVRARRRTGALMVKAAR